ncbi:isoprenylcysteine carboxylmethyltransferase family protein [Arthrobacter sp. ISL-95]|uniref:methyltransferase family protein n=1 Tax=Arthrobacter sp. ISL-95 TaxID=2819116 RepID=UPI001BE7A6C4|nr:isoprenylcysteine carboxylmethyltransferase family protein [Arthrobacter sp. ISL-95]MBT2587037.1 isoprenylcysteine carboxylmethyltransferase family protein [Arthrobacter sp. ISL-95]
MKRQAPAASQAQGWGRIYFAVQAAAGLAWWVGVFLSPALRTATLGTLDPVAVAAFDIPLFVIASGAAAFGVKAAAGVAAGWTGLVAIALTVYATITTEAGWGVLIMVAAAACSVVALFFVVQGRVPTELMVRGPFAFRPAPTRRGIAANVGATMGQLIFFWGFFLVVLPSVIWWLEQRWDVSVPFPSAAAPAGLVVLVLASSLGIASAVTMSSAGRGTPLPSAMPNRLVIAGPYRWVRNPMAVAGISQGAAVGLMLGSWLVVAYAVLGSLLWNYAVRPHEEADLERRFGTDFERYRDSVRCWIPRLRRN